MKVCPKCGRWYDDADAKCPRDGMELELIQDVTNTEMTPEQIRTKRRKDWTFILIGMPLFLLFLYGIFYIMGKLMGA